MSVRVVLAAIVTLALLASSLPLLEEAQQARGEQRMEESASEIRDTAVELARRNDPVPPGVPGARRHVSVDLPENAGSTALRIGAGSGESDADTDSTDLISSRIEGRDAQTMPIDVDVRVRKGGELVGDDTPLVVREDSTLTLEYRLVAGDPAVVVTRGFKSENRTSGAHARFPAR